MHTSATGRRAGPRDGGGRAGGRARRRNGRYSGFPVLGVKWQRMESAALRASHRLGPGQKGVLIRNVAPTSPAAGVLAAGDIVMRFDGMQVACDGTVPFRCGAALLSAVCVALLLWVSPDPYPPEPRPRGAQDRRAHQLPLPHQPEVHGRPGG